MILYGWNHYSLRSVSPEELGIFDERGANIRFEYRQKYFHLFFIPFFPIGRFWGVKRDGKLYHTPPELEDSLREFKPKGKSAVWAWSGPLLIVAGMILFNISSSIAERESSKRMQVSASLLSAFFQDKSKTDPLFKKMEAMNYIIDSALEKDEYAKVKVDTSQSGLLELYIKAKLTQTDSLTGYTRDNTFIVDHFYGENKQNSRVVSETYENALATRKWEGDRWSDTGSVFTEMRKLENYQYVLVLKEYNRLDPEMIEDGYNPGYSFMNGAIIEIASGKVIKRFKLIGSNSEKVSKMQLGKSKTSPAEWKRTLEQDLNMNAFQGATRYVFGEEPAKHY